MDDEHDARVRIATVIVLGAALCVAIAGLTMVAVFTDRDLFRAEIMTLVLALAVATVGGLSPRWWRQNRARHRWRIERQSNGGDDHDPDR